MIRIINTYTIKWYRKEFAKSRLINLRQRLLSMAQELLLYVHVWKRQRDSIKQQHGFVVEMLISSQSVDCARDVWRRA